MTLIEVETMVRLPVRVLGFVAVAVTLAFGALAGCGDPVQPPRLLPEVPDSTFETGTASIEGVQLDRAYTERLEDGFGPTGSVGQGTHG